ncbi:ATP-grasp domain-containing protein, partial [Moraxella catarrhalis]|uniref:ATP-grasp domain-containing protein n=1 Tax=Moraxella catarrhalis TaxID=480 RepID=UPI00217D77D2
LPVIAKKLIIKTANRTQTMAVFVANRMTKLPPSPFLSYVVVGVLTLELFVSDDGLIANEIAPRVHNSGHWTIEGANTSQFEN